MCLLADFWKTTTTWNHQNLHGLWMETPTANYLSFHMKLNTAKIHYAEVELWHRKKPWTDPAIHIILTKNINSFLLSLSSFHVAQCQRSLVLIGRLQTSLLKGETASVHFKLMKFNCVLHKLVFDELPQKSQQGLNNGQLLLLEYDKLTQQVKKVVEWLILY